MFADGGAAGRFQILLGTLIAGSVVGAFAAASRFLTGGLRVGGASLLVGLVYGVVLGDVGGALAAGSLLFGVGLAASGTAALGVRLGTPTLPAGAIAASVLWIAMGGLFWADPISERLPRRERHAFRQAVLHADPALAMAYDGAHFDRLRSPEVYFEVPLASSLHEVPRAVPTAAVWGGWGLLAWAGAALVGLLSGRGRKGGAAALSSP